MSSGFAREFLVPESVKNACVHTCVRATVSAKTIPCANWDNYRIPLSAKPVCTGDIDRKTSVE